MADKTINELTAATTMGNDDLLVLQQGGTAKKLSGKQLGDYVYNAAAEKVSEVNKAVDDARSSINDIVESVQSMTELGTDTTLTTTGMAADAKAAGDKIKAVETAAMADLSQGAAIESMIAGRETTMEATKNYTSGSLVIVNDTLYKLDANVASGESLIPEINCHITTVAAVIISRVPSSRTVNDKALSADITLTAEDIPYDDSLSEHASGSVGEVVSGLKETIDNIPKINSFNLTRGRYIYSGQTIGQPPVLNSSAGLHAIIDVSFTKNGGNIKIEFDSITINATVSTLLTDDDGNVVYYNVTLSKAGGIFSYNNETNKYEANFVNIWNAKQVHVSIYGGSNTGSITLTHAEIGAPQQIFYVSANGSDDNIGTSTNFPLASIKKAIEKRATKIRLLSDIYESVRITNKNLTIFGDNHTIYGDTPLTTEAYNSILRAPYEADTLITNCFVNKTTPLTASVSGSAWKGLQYAICCYADDQKLLPVEDIATVESAPNSFTWADGYFYINATGTRFSYVSKNYCISAIGGTVINLHRVNMKHTYSNVFSVVDGSAELHSCIVCGSVNNNGIYAENSNLLCDKCDVSLTWNDGINTHSTGFSKIVDCYCHDCSDDGVSQHDNTTGVIIGGEFCRCGKGGIASPVNAAKVDIYNAYCHDNDYGIYATASASAPQTYNVHGSVIKGNRIGLMNSKHTVRLYNNKIEDNTTNISNQEGGTVIDL